MKIGIWSRADEIFNSTAKYKVGQYVIINSYVSQIEFIFESKTAPIYACKVDNIFHLIDERDIVLADEYHIAIQDVLE